MTIKELIGQMIRDKIIDERIPWHWSWGDKDYCDRLFRYVFRMVDGTIDEYEHLPEYDEVIDWMTEGSAAHR